MVKIVMRVVEIGEMGVMRMLVGHHQRTFLTVVLKVRRMLVLIVVTMIDEGVRLLKMIRRFLANPVCVMRECTNPTIFIMTLALKHEFHDMCVMH